MGRKSVQDGPECPDQQVGPSRTTTPAHTPLGQEELEERRRLGPPGSFRMALQGVPRGMHVLQAPPLCALEC